MALVININQVGLDVVVSGSGTANLGGITSASTQINTAQIIPSDSTIIIGSGNSRNYEIIAGPSNFGTGITTLANSSIGDTFGLQFITADIYLNVPDGYTTNSPLLGTSTYNNTDFGTLGISGGTYVFTWATGLDADSLTLNVCLLYTSDAADE